MKDDHTRCLVWLDRQFCSKKQKKKIPSDEWSSLVASRGLQRDSNQVVKAFYEYECWWTWHVIKLDRFAIVGGTCLGYKLRKLEICIRKFQNPIKPQKQGILLTIYFCFFYNWCYTMNETRDHYLGSKERKTYLHHNRDN